jgi:hypothetical protein
MNIDVDVYMNQFISFFEKNPNSLSDLIGKNDKNIFYRKVREQCYNNVKDGNEISLTKSQIIEIVNGLSSRLNQEINNFGNLFETTKISYYSLN